LSIGCLTGITVRPKYELLFYVLQKGWQLPWTIILGLLDLHHYSAGKSTFPCPTVLPSLRIENRLCILDSSTHYWPDIWVIVATVGMYKASTNRTRQKRSCLGRAGTIRVVKYKLGIIYPSKSPYENSSGRLLNCEYFQYTFGTSMAEQMGVWDTSRWRIGNQTWLATGAIDKPGPFFMSTTIQLVVGSELAVSWLFPGPKTFVVASRAEQQHASHREGTLFVDSS